jgi:hypothetical protein
MPAALALPWRGGWGTTGLRIVLADKPAGAWTAGQAVDIMLPAMARGDSYILSPDNDVTRSVDERRITWAAGDIIENRPALSRWHPDHADAFAAFMNGDR